MTAELRGGRGMRSTMWLFALALVALLLAGAASAEEPKHGGILKYAVVSDPPTYDCHASGTFAVIHYVAPHYSTLLKLDPAHFPAVTGHLPTSWGASPDTRTYTCHLAQ